MIQDKHQSYQDKTLLVINKFLYLFLNIILMKLCCKGQKVKIIKGCQTHQIIKNLTKTFKIRTNYTSLKLDNKAD